MKPGVLIALLVVSLPALAAPRIVAVSGYRAQDRQHLAAAVKAARLPSGTAVFFGTYGINKDDLAAARSIPGGRYAPIVTPQPKQHPMRRLSPADEAKIPAALKKYAGAIPELAGLPTAERVAWGVEMGKRVRDQIRQAQRVGIAVEAFQLDEIWPSASKSGAQGAAVLQFMTGAIEGLHTGRAVLGDRPMRGLVHVAHPGRLAALRGPDAARFFRALNKVATHFIAEEYPPFSGDPRATARRLLASRDALRTGNADRKALAARFVAGLTPGFKEGPSLGGRVRGQSDAAAHRWRGEFIAEHVARGVAGISEFNWNGGDNVKPAVMRVVFQQIAHAYRK